MKQSDLGSMLIATVRYVLRCPGAYTAEYTGGLLRRHFASCDDYDKRQIITEIDVAIAVPRDHLPPTELEDWTKLVEEIRPPKAPFTVDYRCARCAADHVKLWRRPYSSGCELICAPCLAPKLDIDADGNASSELLHGRKTDQIEGWVPAVPVDDTFWGYTSVPTADVRWWRALRTYPTDPDPKPEGGT